MQHVKALTHAVKLPPQKLCPFTFLVMKPKVHLPSASPRLAIHSFSIFAILVPPKYPFWLMVTVKKLNTFWHKFSSIFISSFVNCQITHLPNYLVRFGNNWFSSLNIWRRLLAPSGTITSVDLNTRYQTSSKKLRIVLANRETKVHSLVFFPP